MAHHKAFLAPLAMLFGGCAAIEGLWLITLKPRPGGDVVETCDENFANATCREWDTGGYGYNDEGWTREREEDPADFVVIGEVVRGSDGRASMALGSRILTGDRIDGSWVLTFEAEGSDSLDETHTEGYRYTELETTRETHQLGLGAPEGGVRKGRLTSSLAYEGAWTESDEWNSTQVGRYGSALPWWLLEGSGYTGYYGYYGGNSRQGDDCAEAICSLEVTQEVAFVWDVEAVRIREDEADDILAGHSAWFELPGF